MGQKWLLIPLFSTQSATLSPALVAVGSLSPVGMHLFIPMTQHYPDSSLSLTTTPLSFSLPISVLSCYKCNISGGVNSWIPLYCPSAVSSMALTNNTKIDLIPHPYSLCLQYSLPYLSAIMLQKGSSRQSKHSPRLAPRLHVFCDSSSVSVLLGAQGTENACLL